jgi:S1-C subfamily serine protease
MPRKPLLWVALLLASASAATLPVLAVAQVPQAVPAYLKSISVMIRAAEAHGSGVVVVRAGTAYVWTAEHVIRDLRHERRATDARTGRAVAWVEYAAAEVFPDGALAPIRAEVVRCSEAEDLALLRVVGPHPFRASAEFVAADAPPEVGAPTRHVGSFLGPAGRSSYSEGVVSATGRDFEGKVYDQVSHPSYPGSSGGGTYTADGHCLGLLTRGYDATFGLIVPTRRLRAWAVKAGVAFAVDPAAPVPDLAGMAVEDAG